MDTKTYRQGDVLLKRTNRRSIPKKSEQIEPDNGRVILAYGEVTGHAHALDSKLTQMYRWEGARLLDVRETADLSHEEHSTITLEPGIYEVTQQREYHPEEIRSVRD